MTEKCDFCAADWDDCQCGTLHQPLPATSTGSVAVPIVQLEKLEKAREQLYDYLTTRLKHAELVELQSITGQIWRVANTRKWQQAGATRRARMDGQEDQMRYLIFSRKHTTGIAMWWRPNAAGYTNNLDDAGRYSKEDAESHCSGMHGDAMPVAELEAYRLSARRIVDLGDANNRATLNPPND